MSCLYRDYRIVEGFEDYIISNCGIVWSLKYGKVRELKFYLDQGYERVVLSKNNKKGHTYIHSLVGNAFIGKRTGEMTFDHIDRNPRNNRADNIRLATKSEQAKNTKNRESKLNERYIYLHKNRGHDYYRIQIRRDCKMEFCKSLNVKKYSLEDAIKVRDDFLTSEAKN